MLELIGVVVAVAVVTMIVLALGVWSPYWAASGVVRWLDRGIRPRSAEPRVVDHAAERRYRITRLRDWARHVNGRF